MQHLIPAGQPRVYRHENVEKNGGERHAINDWYDLKSKRNYIA